MDSIINTFDTWITAQGVKSKGRLRSIDNISLEGVTRMRELILDMAVRGQLVAQDADDEPANALLDKILTKKSELLSHGKSKEIKLLHSKVHNGPFELPKGWLWTELVNVGLTSTGKTPDTKVSSFFGGSTPFIGPGNVDKKGEIVIETERTLTEVGCEESTVAEQGDILMVCIGGSIGKSAIVKSRIAFNQQLNAIHPVIVDSAYLEASMNATHFQRELRERATGSATPIINRSKWEGLLISLPPFAEQHRIVTKVNELMAACDELERAETNHLKTHDTLVRVVLDGLTAAQDAEEFEQAWQRVEENFDVLFTTEDSIEQLKQTILQLAVMGKLVPQDPNDEPASELLRKIYTEKRSVVKKDKPFPPVAEKEKLFALPKSWQWERLGNISFLVTDGTHYTPKYTDEGIPFLSVKDLSRGYIDFSDTRFISKEEHEELSKRCRPKKGDLLLTKVGTTGIPVLVNIDVSFSIFVSVALIKFPIKYIDGRYFELLIKSPFLKAQSKEGTEGIGNKNLVLRKITSFVLAIPPLKEQHRIVDKLNELFAFCDRLKEKIIKSNIIENQMADSILDQID